ncbi:MAG: hypothetical protein HOP99_06335 [Dermatophilaceae bacterium]|nr:hypothetical protein [Dermatophilaceae bacterium]
MSDLTFEGQSFALASKVGLMPLMKFAHIARQGVDANDMEGLVAIYDMLRNVIADEDWERFESHATTVRADGDDLMGLVQQAIQAISERPTERPSDSSDGPQTTSVSSAGDSSSRVIRRLEEQGRPSLALMVQQAQEQGSRASA